MRIAVLLDQNIPPRIAAFIRSKRSDWAVMHVCDVGLNGALDEVIFRWAQEQRAIVLTFDGDFADARMYPVGSHAGVIRLRVWPTTIERTEEALTRLLDSTIDDHLQGSLVIVDDRRIRVRRAARHG